MNVASLQRRTGLGEASYNDPARPRPAFDTCVLAAGREDLLLAGPVDHEAQQDLFGAFTPEAGVHKSPPDEV